MHQKSKPDNVFWSSCARNLIKKRYDNKKRKWCLKPDHSSTRKCNSLLKVDCGGGLKAPSCHYCYDKNGHRRCNGDCEYNNHLEMKRCETYKFGCLDSKLQCEYNPIFKGWTNTDACKKTWKESGRKVSDTCKKSCNKCSVTTKIKQIGISTKDVYHAHTYDHISMTVTDDNRKQSCHIKSINDGREYTTLHRGTSDTFTGSALDKCRNFTIGGRRIRIKVSTRGSDGWLMGSTTIYFTNGKTCRCENNNNYWLEYPHCNYNGSYKARCDIWITCKC